MKRYLILEYSEFNGNQMNQDYTAQSVSVNNIDLSADGYDRSIDIKRQQNVRLNNILYTVFKSTPDGYKTSDRKVIEEQDFSSLKVLRMTLDDITVTVYFSFIINEKEYFGVIRNFNTDNPDVSSEAFSDSDLYQNKEWQIRTKGLLIKVLRKWTAVEPGEYKALCNVTVYNNTIGTMSSIKNGATVVVLRSTYDDITVNVNGDTYTIRGKNYYFFNYYFEPIITD